MFAMNGQGLGHLIRSTIVSRALASVGERPVIFSGGEYHAAGLAQFPVRLVPSLWGASDDVRRRVASELHSMAVISLPSVIVEDTHPAPIQLPAAMRRVLLVRPTSFEYLTRLNELASALYSTFLLCDSPDSPTWPYDEAQTLQVAGWQKWHGIGPVYRTPSEDEIRQVCARYDLSGDHEVCVFTMGAGAVKVNDPKGQDVICFLRLALQVADAIQTAGSQVRLLFVKGPYFPPRIPIPSRFEVVHDEQQMPALLKIAKGAVIRAGFNTPWECLAGGTPFIPQIGTTYAEPVIERVNRMTSFGLVPPDIETFWFDDRWRAQYRRVARSIVAAHPGMPEPRQLARLILDRRRNRPAPKPKPRARRPSAAKPPIPFVIRIDDVICREPALCWLLGVLAARGLCASLEVVPYLIEFDEAFLNRLDPSGVLFEVSQHGYAHAPRTSARGSLCEFLPESTMPTAEECEVIARGKQQMERAFPKRFTGGFSPPYDALPPWLPATWRSFGGAFVSSLHTKSVPGAPLPVARAGVEVWDFADDRAFSRDTVTRLLAVQLALDGHTGIVLHPHCLRNRLEKLRLLNLLDHVEEEGAGTVSLRDVALGRVQPAPAGLRIGRLRSSFREESLERPGRFHEP